MRLAVTGHSRHFRRIPDLEMLTYGDDPGEPASTANAAEHPAIGSLQLDGNGNLFVFP